MYLVHSGPLSKYQDYTVCAKHTVELCKLHTSAKPFVNSCWISQQSSWKVLLEDSGPPFYKHCAVFDKSADKNNLLLSHAQRILHGQVETKFLLQCRKNISGVRAPTVKLWYT